MRKKVSKAKRITAKLVSAIVISAVLAVSALLVVVYSRVSDAFLTKSEELLQATTGKAIQETSAWMNRTLTMLETQRDTIEYGDMDIPEMEAYIKHTVDQNEAYPAGLYVALTDGSLYHASFVPGPDFDTASKSWYQDGIASEKFILGDVYFDEGSQSYVVGASGRLKSASHEVASGAQQVSSGAVALSQGSAEQAASVQAIEEGFILDVLQNYTTYDTFYQINKEIEEDPRCKTVDAKRQIARFVELHETNIAQRVEVIVEHFRMTVMPELGGMAKAMVITASRQGAVKYRQAFEDYTKKKGYSDIKALVAFSGKVKLPDDETEYSKASMNGFPEDRLTKEFDKDEYQVLLVANKYQTGFDQPKLCAMYVLKKLKGVSAVQTLSRLNRICPPFEKKTFVLDFANTYEDIKAAFAPYYTTTLLSTFVTPTAIYDLEAQIDAYTVLDPDDIEKANELLYKGNISSKDKQKLTFYFKRSKNVIEQYEPLK